MIQRSIWIVLCMLHKKYTAYNIPSHDNPNLLRIKKSQKTLVPLYVTFNANLKRQSLLDMYQTLLQTVKVFENMLMAELLLFLHLPSLEHFHHGRGLTWQGLLWSYSWILPHLDLILCYSIKKTYRSFPIQSNLVSLTRSSPH